MAERVDIFDDRNQFIGVKSKKQAHIDGDWHRVFICIAVSKIKRTVLLQLKDGNRYTFTKGSELDFSAGGHYQTGESIAAGIRELHEELGIKDVKYSDLIPLGIRQTAATITSDYKVYEFQYHHLWDYRKRELSDFAFDQGELVGLCEVSIEDGLSLLLGKRKSISAQVLTKTGIEETTLTKGDFPRSYIEEADKIFLKLFITADHYVHGVDVDKLLV